MNHYRTPSPPQPERYYSYQSRLLHAPTSKKIGYGVWCVLVASGMLSRFDIITGDWLIWPFLTLSAVYFVIAAWRWRLQRRVLANAGFVPVPADDVEGCAPASAASKGGILPDDVRDPRQP